jgi:hypothetical protein
LCVVFVCGCVGWVVCVCGLWVCVCGVCVWTFWKLVQNFFKNSYQRSASFVNISPVTAVMSMGPVGRELDEFLPACFLYDLGRPGSSVGITTGYGLEGPEIESRLGRDLPYLSRPALGFTQHPVQWVPGLSRG